MKRFYDTYFAPNNAVLVVSGDITEPELRAKLEPLLAGWKPKKVPPVKVPKIAAPAQPRIVVVDKPGAPQTSIAHRPARRSNASIRTTTARWSPTTSWAVRSSG